MIWPTEKGAGVTGEISDEPFDDPSERREIRRMQKQFRGNGVPGVMERLRFHDKSFYLIYFVLGGIATLIVDGRLRVAPNTSQSQGVVIGSTGVHPARTVLTTEEVADELGVNADTVRRRNVEGTLHDYTSIGVNQWKRVRIEH